MTFADTVKRHIYKYESLYAIGCGTLLIVGGVYSLILGSVNTGIGYMLMGISFITAQFSLGCSEPPLQTSPGKVSIYLKRKFMFVCACLIMGFAMWAIIFKPFSNSGDDTAKREVGVQQEVVDQVPKSNSIKSDTLKGLKQADVSGDAYQGATSGGLDALKQLMPPDLHDDPMLQKLIEVTSSDSFQSQVKEQNPQTIQEYVNLLEAHGVTGLSEMGIEKQIADSYDFMAQKYQAENPGKDPEEEDEVMAKRFGEVLKEYGLMKGTESLMTDQENVLWISARFKGDESAFNEWWRDVMTVYESDESTSPALTPTDSDFLHGEFLNTPSDETTLDIPLAETEQAPSDRALLEMWEESTITDTSDRGIIPPPPVEPEKVVTEVSPEPPAFPTEEELETALRERFSSERFERALSTLERYGEEEGLRRLRESDPELARQIADFRNGEERQRALKDSEEYE